MNAFVICKPLQFHYSTNIVSWLVGQKSCLQKGKTLHENPINFHEKLIETITLRKCRENIGKLHQNDENIFKNPTKLWKNVQIDQECSAYGQLVIRRSASVGVWSITTRIDCSLCSCTMQQHGWQRGERKWNEKRICRHRRMTTAILQPKQRTQTIQRQPLSQLTLLLLTLAQIS